MNPLLLLALIVVAVVIGVIAYSGWAELLARRNDDE